MQLRYILLSILLITGIGLSQQQGSVNYRLHTLENGFNTVQKDSILALVKTTIDTILNGTATIPAGNSSVVVTHGLGITPTISNMNVWCYDWSRGNEFKIVNINSTTFTILLDSTIALDTVTYDLHYSWQIFNADVITVSNSNRIKSALEFSGVYNDSTAMDGTALSTAAKWCADNGYVLKIPAGKYLLSTNAIFRVYPNNVIIGDYGKTIIYTSIAPCYPLYPYNTDWDDVDSTQRNLYIDGITVEGVYPYGSTTPGASAGIYIELFGNLPLNKIIIKNCSVTKTGGEAIKIVGAKVGWIDNCFVSNTKFTAFTLYNNLSILTNSYSEQTNTGAEVYATRFWNDYRVTTGLIISNNKIHTRFNWGIWCGVDGFAKINNNIIEGDTAGWNQDYCGIEITSMYPNPEETELIDISNNYIKSYYTGITTRGTVRNYIRNLKIQNNTINNTYIRSINISDTSSQGYLENVEIKNNTITNWNMAHGFLGNQAIRIYKTDSVVVEGNRVYKANQSGYENPMGILESDGVVVRNNNFTQELAGYIEVDSISSNYKIYDNEGLKEDYGIYKYQSSEYESQLWETNGNGLSIGGQLVIPIKSYSSTIVTNGLFGSNVTSWTGQVSTPKWYNSDYNGVGFTNALLDSITNTINSAVSGIIDTFSVGEQYLISFNYYIPSGNSTVKSIIPSLVKDFDFPNTKQTFYSKVTGQGSLLSANFIVTADALYNKIYFYSGDVNGGTYNSTVGDKFYLDNISVKRIIGSQETIDNVLDGLNYTLPSDSSGLPTGSLYFRSSDGIVRRKY